MKEKKTTTRSAEFVANFQLEAVCGHLRNLILRGIEPGPLTHGMVKSLRDEFVSRATGKPIERIPEVTPEISPADLLAVAELLLATIIAHLTPEELDERRRVGFPTPPIPSP